jgi:hypothetical protein
MTELVNKLLSKKSDKRNSFYDKNESSFSNDELMHLIGSIEYGLNDDDDILIHSIAMNSNLNSDMLKVFILSGKYGAGAIKGALYNPMVDESTLKLAYNKSRENQMWEGAIHYNMRDFGKDYFENTKQQVDDLILAHPNCPKLL